jgi:hypothetical protein
MNRSRFTGPARARAPKVTQIAGTIKLYCYRCLHASDSLSCFDCGTHVVVYIASINCTYELVALSGVERLLVSRVMPSYVSIECSSS